MNRSARVCTTRCSFKVCICVLGACCVFFFCCFFLASCCLFNGTFFARFCNLHAHTRTWETRSFYLCSSRATHVWHQSRFKPKPTPHPFASWPGQKAVLIGKCLERRKDEAREEGPTCDYSVLHTLRRRLGSRETICNRAISFELPQQLPRISDSHMANNWREGSLGKWRWPGGDSNFPLSFWSEKTGNITNRVVEMKMLILCNQPTTQQQSFSRQLVFFYDYVQ